MKLLIAFILLSSLIGAVAQTAPTGEVTVVESCGSTIIHFGPIREVNMYNAWWENGTYTPGIVARLRAEDANRIVRTDGLIESGRFSSNDTWIVKQRAPRYNHITTNTVHWMKPHPATTNDLCISFTAYERYGWINLYWKEKLSDTKWIRVRELSKQHRGLNTFNVYMHPKSEVTKKMLASDTGFFSMGKRGTIVKIDLSKFFIKPKAGDTPVRAALAMEPVILSGPPGIPGG